MSHTSSRKHSDTYYGAFIEKLLQRLGGSDSEAMMRLHHSPTGSPASASTRTLQRLSAERAFAGMPTTDAVTGGAADTSAVPTFATAPASTSVVSTLVFRHEGRHVDFNGYVRGVAANVPDMKGS